MHGFSHLSHAFRMPLLLKNVPEITYQGFDAATTVIEKVKVYPVLNDWFPPDNVTGQSRVSFTAADLSSVLLPGGRDLIFSQDALQHLSMQLIIGVLRNFKQAAPKWLMVGSYPFAVG